MDSACREHDIVYSRTKSGRERHVADKLLKAAAVKRITAGDASFGERMAATTVAGAMKIKTGLRKIGGGLKHKHGKKRFPTGREKVITFSSLIRGARSCMNRAQPRTANDAVKVALLAARRLRRGKRVVGVPRVIKVPTFSGGALPIIPILTGLASVGSIVNSAMSVIKTIKELRNTRKLNTERKIGSGLYLLPYRGGGRRGGSGLYLRPANPKNFQ